MLRSVLTFSSFVSSDTHLYTMVAHGAVWAPRRPVELARDAPFHAHSDAVHFHALVERSAEVVLSVLVRRGYNDNKFDLEFRPLCGAQGTVSLIISK